ncbi:hypothetical protein KEJ37_03150 [Candidatus Bathyarchaeota archaeon]|nr:hypothetical protein [Candidatus Bathyarchaeota archaeon]
MQFCKEIFGMEKKYEYLSHVGFECGGVEIGLIPKLKGGERVAPTSPSVEFLVDDVEKFCSELKSKGVKFIKNLHEEPWWKTCHLHRPRWKHFRNCAD